MNPRPTATTKVTETGDISTEHRTRLQVTSGTDAGIDVRINLNLKGTERSVHARLKRTKTPSFGTFGIECQQKQLGRPSGNFSCC